MAGRKIVTKGTGGTSPALLNSISQDHFPNDISDLQPNARSPRIISHLSSNQRDDCERVRVAAYQEKRIVARDLPPTSPFAEHVVESYKWIKRQNWIRSGSLREKIKSRINFVSRPRGYRVTEA